MPFKDTVVEGEDFVAESKIVLTFMQPPLLSLVTLFHEKRKTLFLRGEGFNSCFAIETKFSEAQNSRVSTNALKIWLDE